jgi:hypothetical protein
MITSPVRICSIFQQLLGMQPEQLLKDRAAVVVGTVALVSMGHR